MIEEQEERAYQKRLEKLADYFGFDVSEIEGLDVDIQPNTGNDDFHYGWCVRFPEETPQHIKDAVGDDGFANLDLHFFDEEQDLPEEERPTFDNPPAGLAEQLVEEQRRKNRNTEDNTGNS